MKQRARRGKRFTTSVTYIVKHRFRDWLEEGIVFEIGHTAQAAKIAPPIFLKIFRNFSDPIWREQGKTLFGRKTGELMNKQFLPNAVLSGSTNAGGVRPTIHLGPVRMRRTGRFSAAFLILATLIGQGSIVLAQAPPDTTTISRVPNPPLSSALTSLPGDLRSVPVPGPSNLNDFVRDPAMARALGKALFWDMQVGSDGIQSCASCHFRAGADPRSKNQLSPGLKHVPAPDLTFSAGRGPNFQLEAAVFPLTRLANPGVRGFLDPTADSNDVVSSQGIHHPGNEADPLRFLVGSANTRRVEPRNTPTTINAVFNHRQFWDGRAENIFNGVNHLGQRDPDSKLFRADDPKNPIEVRVELVNSSLASQAVAPIVSDLEMADPNRMGRELARGK